MAVGAVAGRDEANPAGTPVHKMEKLAVLESGAYGQEKLEDNEHVEIQGACEELVRS